MTKKTSQAQRRSNSPGSLIDRFEPEPKRDPRAEASANDKLLLKYREIGLALQACEAKSLRVGIPWLPPTARVCELRRTVDVPVDEFLRTHLAAIGTETLDSYCDDLETLPNVAESSALLGISGATKFERIGFIAASVTLIFFIGLMLLTTLGIKSVVMCSLFSFFAAATFGALSITMTTDSYRRDSFCWIISKEILRRSGSGGNSNKVRLCGAGTDR